jgi:hypothetical protein
MYSSKSSSTSNEFMTGFVPPRRINHRKLLSKKIQIYRIAASFTCARDILKLIIDINGIVIMLYVAYIGKSQAITLLAYILIKVYSFQRFMQ